MKTSVIQVLAFSLPLLLAAGATAAEKAGDGREADHAALRALMGKAVEAINNQDMDALAACFTRDFMFTTVDQSVLTSTLALKSYYDRMLRSEASPVSGLKMEAVAETLTTFLGTDAGYCRGTSNDAYTLRRNGQVVHMPSRWTAIVVKDSGQWKLAAVHAGVNILENPVLDAITASMWRKMLVVAGIGILVGIGVGALVARRRKKIQGNN